SGSRVKSRECASPFPVFYAAPRHLHSSPTRRSSDLTAVPVPEALRDLLPESFDGQALRTLDDAGICAGQGLRTGCNRFFYVRLRSEEHTSELQSREKLVCRLLLEKKKNKETYTFSER